MNNPGTLLHLEGEQSAFRSLGIPKTVNFTWVGAPADAWGCPGMPWDAQGCNPGDACPLHTWEGDEEKYLLHWSVRREPRVGYSLTLHHDSNPPDD